MSTKRQVINSLRDKLKERNADSTYTNQFLYGVLLEHSKWLIRREVSAGRIYTNNSLFQTLGCTEVIETSTIDVCCPIKVNCKIYRTKNKLPKMWIDKNGPVIKTITSVDGTTEFFMTTPDAWQNKRKDPYQKMSDMKYSFFAENYLWFPENNPHRVNINGYYTDDIQHLSECHEEKKPCTRFLDTKFNIPDWLEAEMFAKALEQLAGITKRMPEDVQIDKNPNRKN